MIEVRVDDKDWTLERLGSTDRQILR